MEILIPIVIAIITSVVGPSIVEWIRKMKENKPKDPLKDAIQYNETIEQQLDLIFKELECDQIYIAQFHNGGHFYPTGKSISKFSIFYEIVSPSIPSLKTTFQNIPVSLFSKLLSFLYENKEIAIEDFNKNKDYTFLYPSDIECKSTYILTITDLNNRIIGIIGINFMEHKHEMTKHEWIFIRQKLGAIGNLMSNYLNNKPNENK